MSVLSIGFEEGYSGAFTREQYPPAWRNGTRVRKINSERGDGTPDSTLGTVLGSVGHDSLLPQFMYFIEWDNRPRYAVGCLNSKVSRA